VTHLGQRLSALIDGELEGSERERVLLHMTRCDSCREEVAALRTLKRRMSALGDEAAAAGLTGRLMRLSALGSIADAEPPENPPPAAPSWPDRPGGLRGRGLGSAEQRAGRYFLASSLAVFLAGLGTAAFIAGGESQPQAPTPPATPSVDVMVFPHGSSGDLGTAPPIATPSSLRQRRAFSPPHPSHTRT
jgi:anti-sigma factor RsiW